MRWWAFYLITLALYVEGLIPYNVPFQVVKPTPNHSSMVVVPEGLALLSQHGGSIALVSVVGPYHSGKSFLLNALLQDMKAFQVGKKTSPETKGMWLSRTNLTASDGSEVWLMDSEGFFGPGVEESYDAKVFTVATLVGAHIVYNTVKVIDQQALNLLEMLVQRAQLFRTRSSASGVPGEAPDFLRAEGFPPLTWVVEDFVQEVSPRVRDEGATGWLRTYLEESSEDEDSPEQATDTKALRRSELLMKVYQEVRVHTLFLPATSREQLRDLSKMRWHQLTEEFRAEVHELRQHILRTLQARRSGGRSMTGPSLAQALQFIVRGLQHGMFHELPSIWRSWTVQVAAVSLDDAEAWFNTLTERLDTGQEPVPVTVYNDRLEEARETSMNFYKALVRDFDVPPQASELRKRLDAHLTERLLPVYHERVRHWISEKLLKIKEAFNQHIGSKALPVDMAILENDATSALEGAKQNFSVQLHMFATPHSSGTTAQVVSTTLGRRPVRMPTMTPEPIAQLVSDLRALLGARLLENERATQLLFKMAVSAADEAVAKELQAATISGPGGFAPPVSRAQLDTLGRQAEKECWEAFEERLAPYPWAKGSMLYRGSRALVQAEHLQARLASFRAANEQRLQFHFGQSLEQTLHAYRANRSAVMMPIPEAALEAEQKQLAAWAQQNLLTAATTVNGTSGLSLLDTEAFAEAKAKLDGALREGREQLRERNVEFWKAHADEATRCAHAANQKHERSCGWICLYRLLPWSHKSISSSHFSDCLSRSSLGARMTPPLRLQVFEAWYNKDLGQQSQAVWWRFQATGFTLVGLVVASWLYAASLAQPAPVPRPAAYCFPQHGGCHPWDYAHVGPSAFTPTPARSGMYHSG